MARVTKLTVVAVSVLTLMAWPMTVPAQEDVPSAHEHHHMQVGGQGAGALPREAGQGAFAAIQEIVGLLEADPATDWSKVNIRALREHLVDMEALVLRADVTEKPLPNGIEALVNGQGRTLEAIKRMVPAHAAMINGYRNWVVQVESIESGVRLRVTSDNPDEVPHIKGLGFFGVMASGAHHQMHHLGIAKGEHVH